VILRTAIPKDNNLIHLHAVAAPKGQKLRVTDKGAAWAPWDHTDGALAKTLGKAINRTSRLEKRKCESLGDYTREKDGTEGRRHQKSSRNASVKRGQNNGEKGTSLRGISQSWASRHARAGGLIAREPGSGRVGMKKSSPLKREVRGV